MTNPDTNYDTKTERGARATRSTVIAESATEAAIDRLFSEPLPQVSPKNTPRSSFNVFDEMARFPHELFPPMPTREELRAEREKRRKTAVGDLERFKRKYAHAMGDIYEVVHAVYALVELELIRQKEEQDARKK